MQLSSLWVIPKQVWTQHWLALALGMPECRNGVRRLRFQIRGWQRGKRSSERRRAEQRVWLNAFKVLHWGVRSSGSRILLDNFLLNEEFASNSGRSLDPIIHTPHYNWLILLKQVSCTLLTLIPLLVSQGQGRIASTVVGETLRDASWSIWEDWIG